MFDIKARKDERVQLFLSKLNKGTYSMNVPEKTKEVTSIHANRMIHTLSKKDLLGSQKAILDCIVENQMNRARLVTIKMECVRKMNTLQEKLEILSSYLKEKFAAQLRLEYSSNTAKNDAIKELFSDAYSMMLQIQGLDKLIDIVILDIDNAGWAMKNIVEVLKITAAKVNEL